MEKAICMIIGLAFAMFGTMLMICGNTTMNEGSNEPSKGVMTSTIGVSLIAGAVAAFILCVVL